MTSRTETTTATTTGRSNGGGGGSSSSSSNGSGNTVAKNGTTSNQNQILSTAEDEKWIVAMIEEGNPLISATKGVSRTTTTSNTSSSSTITVVESNHHRSRDVVIRTFSDPSTGEPRQYFVTNDYDDDDDRQIMEVQSLEADFSSYFVERHVVQDGNLYMVNRVDPLFFFLSTQSVTVVKKEENGKTRPWQPVDQILANENVSEEVQRAFSTNLGRCQLRHLCVTFQNDDLLFLKFDTQKALSWLQKKQERVLKSLMDQHHEQSRCKNNTSNRKLAGSSSSSSSFQATQVKGSISDTFTIPVQKELLLESSTNDDTTSGTLPPPPSSSLSSLDPTYLSEAQRQDLKKESLEIVCNYLNEEWSKAFVDYLGWARVPFSTDSSKYGTNYANHTVVSPHHPSTTQEDSRNTTLSSSSLSTTRKTTSVQQTAQSAGNKQLAKVKTKGMKSIASFFGGAAAAAAAAAKKPATKKAKIQ